MKSNDLEVTAFKGEHSVECLGYSFDLPRKGRFNAVKAKALNLPVSIWSVLQREGQIRYDNKLYTYDMVSDGERNGVKVTYCTDSRPIKNIVKHAKNSDLFICEGLYYSSDKIGRAIKTGHMLYSEAAEIAKKSDVKRLWLTHYSPATNKPAEFENMVKGIFSRAVMGKDRMEIELKFEE